MKYSLCILFTCFFSIIQAQNYLDIVNISYTNTSSNEFENSNAQTHVEERALKLTFPIVMNEKTALLTGFYGNKTSLKLDANSPVTDLNVLSLNLGVNQVFNTKWSGTFMLIPRIASDKIGFDAKDLQLGALALFTNTKRKSLKYKYGIYANTENYGLILVPIIGLYYLSESEKFEVNLNLPITADIKYKLFKKGALGMQFEGLGSTYNIKRPMYSNKQLYIAKTSNEICSYFQWQFSKSVYLNSKIGYALGRDYEVYDAKDKIDLAMSSIYFGDNRTQLNENFKDGVFFKFELIYRVHL